ncbi:uncharacterized protein FIESC28_08428 [Fusarium coffeatum]|uniref:Fungal N-terminal domain-containing protein n=1 Tax=Fusarium coffeatum TaxID=231269 RepID=A0A366R6Z8_9HYPO|nr:uncharacterized protein FIESC28_08428 [Fusarium coffeatum]RBR12937.1 hypothetical protein FIESC28_08428 [Fusarium coffeatum]
MDPITAFQVAGTVITFVEFSRTLLNDARDVYKSPSGATSQVVRLGSIADDLNTVGGHISTSLESCPESSRTMSDKRLVNICGRCTEMQNELQQALRGLQARGNTKFDYAISSIATAFRSIWSQSKMNDLDRRLREVQSEMTMAVLMSLWEDEQIHGKSRQESLAAVIASVKDTDRKVDQLNEHLLQTTSYTSSNGSSERSMLFRELWKADWRPDRDHMHEFEKISSDEVARLVQQSIINNLIEKVSTRRWAAYNALRGWEGPVPEWSWEELQETFQNLASLNSSSLRLVLFIDGLDEFDGKLSTLILWIKDIVARFRIKLCVGSRPWTDFKDAFDQYPTLTMQTLTAPDIQAYLNGHFNTSHAFRDWQTLSPGVTESLRHDLLEKADGVFLWVYIVVKELMSALKKGKSIYDISSILNDLPTDMTNLYTKIYGSADPEEAKSAALYFSLLQAAIHPLKSYELWYIEESKPVNANDKKAWASMESVIKRRLNSSTRGMVEVSRYNIVIFHHRSVSQWLSLPEVVPVISSHLSEHVNTRLLLMKGHRARLDQEWQAFEANTSTNTAQSEEWSYYYRGLFNIFYYASLISESSVPTPALLQELEMTRDTLDQIATAMDRPCNPRSAEPMAKTKPNLSRRLKSILPTRARYRGNPNQSATDTIRVDEYEVGHWSLPPDWDESSAQGCFTALVAHFSVHPYVMAQVKKSPDLLVQNKYRVSLLSGAIFGPRSLGRYGSDIPPVCWQSRLRLVEALLDSGAPIRGRIPNDNAVAVGQELYYLDSIELDDMSFLSQIGPEEYWNEVRRLLTMKMSMGDRFRRHLLIATIPMPLG